MLNFNVKYEYWWYLILAILAFFSFYFAIGAYPLFDNNEGLYASIAKLMLQNQEFVIPHLNCVPYIEKPPLLYWLLSLSFSLFGFTAKAARLVTTTSATLTCLAIIIFTKKIKLPQIGIISSLIFTTSIGISIIARMVYFDMLFTWLFSTTLLFLFYWYKQRTIAPLRVAYLFFGLAVLTKGLIAIILIPGSFIFFLLLEKDLHLLLKALDPLGITLFLAIVLPWHLLAIAKHQDFFRHYVIEEHFLRFLNQREPHDYYNGPLYYYFPRIIIYLLPWSFFIPLIFWHPKNSWSSFCCRFLPSANLTVTTEQKLLRFCWCWLLVPLTFFTLSSAKANYYMVISMPALAIILGIKINELFDTDRPKIFSTWSSLILLIISLALFKGYLFFPHKIVMIAAIYSLLSCIVIVFIAHRPTIIAAIIATLIVPLIIVMVTYIKTAKNVLSAEEAGTYLTLQAQEKESSLYIYQDFENISALAFYSPCCYKIIDSKSNDLYYGKTLSEFKRWFISKEELLRNSKQQHLSIVVLRKKLSQFLREMAPLKFKVQKEFALVVVVTRVH